MQIDLLGHACVHLISDGGESLLIDPYESGQFGGQLAYEPIDVEPDWVVVSHDHADHAAVHAVPGDFRLIESGRHGAFEVRRHAASHDEYDGRRRGGSVDILEVIADDTRVVHLADVGESPITSVVQKIAKPDVLLVPVGGFYTIGAAQAWEWAERIQASITIPCHHRTSACSLPIRDARAFAGWRDATFQSKSCPTIVQEVEGSTLFLKHRRAIVAPHSNGRGA